MCNNTTVVLQCVEETFGGAERFRACVTGGEFGQVQHLVLLLYTLSTAAVQHLVLLPSAGSV